MKYSRLPQEELEKLKDDFVDFLVVNGITADDWLSIKENEPINAERIIEQFSDVIWEGVLRKLEYLDKLENDCSYHFKCLNDKIELIRLLKQDNKIVRQMASKQYAKTRELELFDMITNGCVISDGANFESLVASN